jgi:hypothetical protein
MSKRFGLIILAHPSLECPLLSRPMPLQLAYDVRVSEGAHMCQDIVHVLRRVSLLRARRRKSSSSTLALKTTP